MPHLLSIFQQILAAQNQLILEFGFCLIFLRRTFSDFISKNLDSPIPANHPDGIFSLNLCNCMVFHLFLDIIF